MSKYTSNKTKQTNKSAKKAKTPKTIISVIIYDIRAAESKLNPGSDVYTLYCIDDKLKKYEIAVDPTYRNFKQWTNILNDPAPYGIYDNLIVTDRKTVKNVSVISADSRAVLYERLTIEQIENWIEKEINKNKPADLFAFL